MRILLVEDDPDLRLRIAARLAQSHYLVEAVADGREAAFLGDTEDYDAAILDLGLPQLDGLSVLGDWRRRGRTFPVLVLTARSRWSDKLAGFQAGADDYLTKPFELEEVVVRVQALIRRAVGHGTPQLRVGALELDGLQSRFYLDGALLSLTAQEHRILDYLIHHAGRVISRSELIEHVYDRDHDEDSNSIDVLVGRIRRKLGTHSLIQTERGRGFRLEEAPPL